MYPKNLYCKCTFGTNSSRQANLRNKWFVGALQFCWQEQVPFHSPSEAWEDGWPEVDPPKVELCNKLGGTNCLRCLAVGRKCAQMPVQNRSWLQSPVSGIKPFCMEMTVQAQEGSRPCGTDRYRVDNTIVMLKRASVQFGKTLQRMEILRDCSWEQEKKHCLGVGRKDQSHVWPQAFMCQLS